ncbi:hypothetical protein BDZ90DRAFT_250702 [Jaminaea rosea]|uniref:HD/PDEase domain-containing protein n=1 Tax=Jaminaea rosea TaxID=1569628 RepID=A0A316USM9_9BASI|nr:hypothetical protein BDZ90DRAFT_250702 [Jaminaea rosea]PWN28282.1 hypothetical protein BDZ90DRAFT_250702 [Jaminaea rosea]
MDSSGPSCGQQISSSVLPRPLIYLIVQEAEQFAKSHFERIGDPSHDWPHVQRVRDLAFWLRGARSLNDQNEPTLRCDYLVLELAALFHDLVDPKLLPPDAVRSQAEPRDLARAVLGPFWDDSKQGHAWMLDVEQKDRIIEIIINIGWSKDQKRRKQAHVVYDELYKEGVYCWPEFRAISDADRLDAIGAVGVMRCAAYSGVSGRQLLSSVACVDSAVDHIHSKLLLIWGDRLFMNKAKVEAERRQETMRTFLHHLDWDARTAQ